RMSTRRGDGWQCDHGAQYFTARHPLFVAQVAEWEAQGLVQAWQGKIGAYEATGWRHHTEPLPRYVGTPTMNAPLSSVAHGRGMTVERGTLVERLLRAEGGWQLKLRDEDQPSTAFDAVLLAMPAPQAHALAAPWSRQLADEASQVRMLPSWALIAHFDQRPFLEVDAAFINQGPLRWIARQASKPARGKAECWLIHAQAEWSEQHLEQTPEQVAEAMIQALQALGAPAPRQWSIHRWRYADIAAPLDIGSAFDADLKLGCCGDWLCGGKVEGAWLSGNHLAQALIEHQGAAR
ncbi:NAD(P)/FAD-dependent oxidoreductase, partial [Chitinimonas sp.]|uniref:NAD(P)/FAD-dependent oxidoreductase n=1 Tax=Chitinimonas sp. TaxID=1934313 RepID=UPI002F934497